LRNVVVTGASRGLGFGIAERLSKDGFNVIAVARRESQDLAAAIVSSAGALHFQPLATSRERSRRRTARSGGWSTTPGPAPKACSPT
jgi:NAD(P)-dependent dehydrogenase (short-subunit alcohol dehydrogenase family)